MSPRVGCPKCGAPKPCARHGRRRAPERRAYSDTAEYRRVRAEVLERDGLVCAYCREPLTDAELVLAHRIAHDDGGAFEPDNLVPAHRDCNAAAGKRPPQEVL
jgi:5-methylcytosine-specific restriction endonuclease McrA